MDRCGGGRYRQTGSIGKVEEAVLPGVDSLKIQRTRQAALSCSKRERTLFSHTNLWIRRSILRRFILY
jgi:hypothetical protein